MRGHRVPGRAACQPCRRSAARSSRSSGSMASASAKRASCVSAGSVEQPPHRVRLLAVVDAAVLDRAVAAPVPDGRERRRVDVRSATGQWSSTTGGSVVIQSRPQSGTAQPGVPTAPPTVTNAVVPVEADVDALGGVPELGEGRIEVDVTRARSARRGARLVGEHAGDVQQQVGAAGAGRAASRGNAVAGRAAPRLQVEAARRARRSTARRPRPLDLLDEEHVVAEPRSPSTYWSTAQVAPPWPGTPATIPPTRILTARPRWPRAAAPAPARARSTPRPVRRAAARCRS